MYQGIHQSTSENEFNLEVTDINKKLRNIYWNLNLHKNHTKARIVIAAPKCLLKPLSEAITAALKLIFNQIEYYNLKTLILYYNSDVKTFWPIQNNQIVIDAINKTNSRNKAMSLSTFDFSTLYTKIPHQKFKSVMGKLINFCFSSRVKEFIEITKYSAIRGNN